jgi:hypothetical protein
MAPILSRIGASGKAGAVQYVRSTWIEWDGDPIRYMLKYLRKDDKEYQHIVPSDYVNVGRWWGIRNIRPEWELLRLTESDFFLARRILCRWRRANARSHGRKLRFRPGADGDGLWVLAMKDGDNVVRKLLRGLVAATIEADRDRKGEWRLIP